LRRYGNVFDSNGAQAFILDCIAQVKTALPGVTIEVRMDGAFFSDILVGTLDNAGIEYPNSVPFERFTQLKQKNGKRCRWYRLDDQHYYFESQWKPQSRSFQHRYIFVRQRTEVQYKNVVELDLYISYEYGHSFKVL
jgi:hypothetical protein